MRIWYVRFYGLGARFDRWELCFCIIWRDLRNLPIFATDVRSRERAKKTICIYASNLLGFPIRYDPPIPTASDLDDCLFFLSFFLVRRFSYNMVGVVW